MSEQSGGGVGGDTATSPAHPVADLAARLRHRLEDLTTSPVPVWAMSTGEKAQTLLDLATAQAQLDALRLQVLAEADRDPDVTDPGDRTVAEWVARQTRQTKPAARGDLKLARTLETQRPVLAAGMADGRVSLAQARAISRALDLLPVTGRFATTAEQRSTAEAHLVDLAGDFDATALEQLGRRIYAVICPDAVDAYEGTLLEAEEARAARKTTFEMWQDHQGTCHGRFRIPQLHGQMLKKALQALTHPTRVPTPEPVEPVETDNPAAEPAQVSTSSTGSQMVEPVETRPLPVEPVETTPAPVRRGQAFCELLERLRAEDLPATGGGDATVVVTMTLEDLEGRLEQAGVATLDTGARISAREARRLAARHRLIPAVLGGAGQVLDLGATQRLFTKAQRLALTIGQRTCRAEHCTVPAALCQVDHAIPWARGGPTDLANARLLCGPHHRRLTHPGYRHETTPGGRVRFHRRE
ncbi:HNH endonuclease signature motif containing protein [Nocardioides aequoreus]|uniref:HNH endonuclease signature motif containing protein n=1 Tax=Nocardioides aequoreus TaxID=397278 RepID=UPI00068E2F01|nr:HNH endonuclease signature motif containing protein [Nocardioides aequoreus]